MENVNDQLLKIDKLRTVIKVRNGEVVPVDGVDITVLPHSTVGIVGESGCGKSMTAMSIMGLLPKNIRIDSGSINLNGTELTKLSQKEMRKITGDRISIIFQEPMTSLNPVITVGKQVREAITLHRKVSKNEAKEMVVEMFRSVGIPEPERRYYSYPHELSGGLRQRVMIAMAMVCEPELLIADEPTTALDVTVEAQILHLMRKLRDEKNTSIMMITHNLGVVAEICDTVYVMYAGQVVEHTDVYEIFKYPSHPYTEGLLDSLPTVNSKERLNSIPGIVPKLDKLPKGCRFHDRCKYATERCKNEAPPLYDIGNNHTVRCFRAEDKGKEVE
ncbi:MAG: ABC transporter ATP-binding protein [Clostridiales bacterium]|nr:ABC transporter ATP-binding protein [Clostridiales bacterium]MDD7143281.1 ABC transporter ATP-binding protein [bacterium]MDY5457624.1 ABC transporter ATP-binding protein [Bariatricus sp.]